MSSRPIQLNAAIRVLDSGLRSFQKERPMSAFPSVRTRSISQAIRGAAVIVTSEWLTAVEAAEVLRVKHRTVLRWAKTGQIPAHRLSGSRRVTWRFLKSELDAMLSVPSAAEPGRVQCAAE
jgi:excisionase family DNA binding protein